MTTPGSSQQQVTQILCHWRSGDRAALEKLLPLIQLELQRLAHRYMSREQAGRCRKAEVVEMRYFGGLTMEEIAEVLKVHVNTVTRDWSAARAWLFATLSGENMDAI